MSVNRVILVGNLGADPELRSTRSGASVCNLRLATTERFTDRDGNRASRTEWHAVVVWGKQAETCGQFLAKGREIYVEGRLQSRSYTDRDGGERRVVEVHADQVRFLGRGAEPSPRDAAPGWPRQARDQHANGWGPPAANDDGDVPF